MADPSPRGGRIAVAFPSSFPGRTFRMRFARRTLRGTARALAPCPLSPGTPPGDFYWAAWNHADTPRDLTRRSPPFASRHTPYAQSGLISRAPFPHTPSMTYKTDPNTSVGHIHLRVADLDRAIAFYSDVMGFDLRLRYGTQAAFLSAGGYHHHIGLNTWDSQGGTPPAKGHTGLYHVAFLYPDRPALARALKSVKEAGVPIDGAADHGVSEAIYFRDPDGNGIEIYCDRPQEEWPRDDAGSLAMINGPIDLDALLTEA